MTIREPKLLQITTADGLYLHGYYVPSKGKENALLHIHGFAGNFYENDFVHVLASELEYKKVAFLTVNTRGSEKVKDFNTTEGDIRTIGARYELMEEAHLDITAWLKFLLSEGYKKIILQGHSQGTMKVVRYLIEGELKDRINKLILLSPLDIKGQMVANGRKDIEGLLRKAQDKIDCGKGEEMTTAEFDYEGDIFSYNAFVSLYRQDDLGRVFDYTSQDFDFSVLKKIQIPTQIVIGSDDEYFQLTSPQEAMKLLLNNIPGLKGEIINGATHSFRPQEKIMAKEVGDFVVS